MSFMMNDSIPASALLTITGLANEYRKKLYQGPIKPSSMKQYIQNWNRLVTIAKMKLGDDDGKLEEKWYENWVDLRQLISDMRDKRYPDKVISLSSRRNYMSALIQIGQINGLDPERIKLWMDSRTEMNKDLTSSMKNEGTADLVTKDELQEKVFGPLAQGNYIWSCGMPLIQYYMLMKLHTAYNLRNDCCSLHWITQQNWRGIPQDTRLAKNWMVGRSVGRGKFKFTIELNDYKTKKPTDGPVRYELNRDMNTLMNYYLKNCWSKHFGEENMMMSPVFPKGLNDINELTALTSNDMTMLLQKYNEMYVGKKIGTKMLRHSFYTEKYGDVAEELIADAQQSLHSVGTAINHYTHITHPITGAIFVPSLETDNEVTEA